MIYYPGQNKEKRILKKNLEIVISEIFLKCNMNNDDSYLLSKSLVHSDLRGIHSHGVIRVPEYVSKLIDEGVNPKGKPYVVSEKTAAIRINGDNSMGQIGSHYSMQKAIKTAKKTGVAFASLEGSNHCGALDWYTLMASKENLIGIAGTNALPTMAPWGGVDKIVGLNPISISIPGISYDDLVIDTALGQTSHGKIRIYDQKNELLPQGWAFNKHGQPTIQPKEAIEGLIQPIGSFKGIGLAMMVGMLSTVLSNAQYGTKSGNMIDGAFPGLDGQFFIVIDIEAFIDLNEYEKKIKLIIKEFKSSKISSEAKRIYLPGEMENELMNINLEKGIPLNDKTIKNLNIIIDRFSIKNKLILF